MRICLKSMSCLLMVGLSLSSYADAIKGVGEIQIGMTTEQFLDLPVVANLVVVNKEELDKQSDLQKNLFDRKKYVLKESSESEPDKNNLKKVYSPLIVIYELYAPVAIDENRKLKTEVKFFKNRLVEVEVANGAEFIDVLTEKYGKPTRSEKFKIKYCAINRTLYEHKDGYLAYEWSKGNVQGRVMIIENVDDQCVKNTTRSFYTVSNKSEWKNVFDAEYKAENEYKRAQMQKKLQEENNRVKNKASNSLL